MGSVFTASYELSGAAREKAIQHFADEAATQATWKEAARSFGAYGFRPGYDGRPPSSLLFRGKDVPAGFRKVGTFEGGIEVAPLRTTKIGKAAHAILEALPSAPRRHELTTAVGADRNEMSDRAWHYSICCHVEMPTPRYFVRVPRRQDDGWTAPPGLIAVPESELLAAFEAHNAAARQATKLTEAAS